MAENREDVKAQFRAEGLTLAAWARAKGFNPRTVYRVLSGEIKGGYGEAHRIAVALGLKEEPAEPRFRTDIAA